MARPIFALLSLGATLAPAPAQSSPGAEVGAYLARAAAFGFSGQVLVAEKGQVVVDACFGSIDGERGAPILPDSPFNVASFTKQFTAAAVLRLEADGKLRVDDPIGRLLPGVPEEKAGITIHHLLTHTAGLRRDSIRPSDPALSTRDETVKRVLASPLRSKPGERFAYSNDGYRLLAAIVEKVSGQTYRDFVAERLFGPAGMRNTSTYDDPRWAGAAVATGFDEWHSLGSFRDWTAGWHRLGSGGIVSTARDLYAWHLALAGDRVLPPAARARMFAKQTPAEDGASYGYGAFLKETKDGKPLVFHGGDNAGYHSEVRWYPQDDRVLLLLTNRDRFGIDGGAVEKRVVADAIAGILSGADVARPPATVSMPEADLRRFEGEYRFDDSSTARVWSSAGHLVVGVEGQAAIDRLVDPGGKPDASRAEANGKALAILQAIAAGNPEAVRKVLPADEFDNYVPFLAGEVRASAEKLGPVRDVRVLGTVPLPWDPRQTRTYALVVLERGNLDLFLGWTEGALGDVTTGEDRPHPVIYPLAPASEAAFATYDLITSRSARLEFTADAAGKVTSLTLGDATARRVDGG
ncbi:MAG: beta-lactamase family protein [Planctomycetes bacterium]|nr:beta-lactamase family protein [Planctomycetota bacterium]